MEAVVVRGKSATFICHAVGAASSSANFERNIDVIIEWLPTCALYLRLRCDYARGKAVDVI